MKNKYFFTVIIFFTAFASCHKAANSTPNEDFTTLEQDVINDFVNKTALPQYNNLLAAATTLNSAITNLKTNTTDANLQTAQVAWKNTRMVWEQCEGFLIGPVEANDYDPNMDTWPTDYAQMDSLLASNNPLQLNDIQNLSQNLRGYHPIEYLLFRNGENAARTASGFTSVELQYLVSLSADVLNNIQSLVNDWNFSPVNFAQTVLNAGYSNNQIYATKLSFFLDITGDNGMAGICGEVGSNDPDGKMYAPYIARDSTITESPYSDNSLADFKNNIIGAQNVYLGLNGGKGLKDLVAARNKSLDNQIRAQFTAAINSFDNITERYEQAIFNQRLQIQQTLAQLQTLQDLLENGLNNFLLQNIKN